MMAKKMIYKEKMEKEEKKEYSGRKHSEKKEYGGKKHSEKGEMENWMGKDKKKGKC
jgi:hypothetical protein